MNKYSSIGNQTANTLEKNRSTFSTHQMKTITINSFTGSQRIQLAESISTPLNNPKPLFISMTNRFNPIAKSMKIRLNQGLTEGARYSKRGM